MSRKSRIKNFQLISIFYLRIALAIEVTNARDVLKSLRAHRAGVHPQPATDYSRDTFHPFESAEICRARCISNFPQLHPGACRDFAAVHLDFVEIAARRMNHHATDSTIADKKIRSAAHYEKRQVFVATKSNQLRKGVLALRLDPKLRRAAYAERRMFRKRLVKTDISLFAHDRLQLFSNYQIRR